MEDGARTQHELTEEIEQLRTRVLQLEAAEAEYHQVKRELGRCEREFQTLVENAPDGITRVDTDGHFLYCNPSWESMTGISRELAVGRTRQELGFPEDLCRLIEGALRDVCEGRQEIIFEYQFNTSAGVKWYQASAIPEFAEDNSVESILTIIRDITDRKQTENALLEVNAELQLSNQELDAFGFTVAHDLKGPLSVIIGYADVLLGAESAPSEEEIHKGIEVIFGMGLKMDRIIEELMLLAGLRDAEVEMKPLDMTGIVADAQSRLTHLIEEARAEVIYPERWPVALGHAPWVEEVWANYLSNAIKYGGKPPRIELGAAQTDDDVCFWVRDNGTGLTSEEMSRLFTPSERLDRMHTPGHGIGLSIVQRIVDRMGGQVSVESAGVPGQGSVFSFTLPPN